MLILSLDSSHCAGACVTFSISASRFRESISAGGSRFPSNVGTCLFHLPKTIPKPSLFLSVSPSAATNSGGLYRIGSTYLYGHFDGVQCQYAIYNRTGSHASALKGQLTSTVSKIFLLSKPILCVTLPGISLPGIKRPFFLWRNELQFCQRISR